MRRTISKAVWLLSAILLISGCSAASQTPGSSNTASAGQEEGQEQEEGREEIPEEISAQSSKESGAGTLEEMPYSFSIVPGEDCPTDLLVVLDAENGERKFILRGENRTEENLIVKITGLRINDSIVGGPDVRLYLDAGETRIQSINDLREIVFTVEKEQVEVRTITGAVSVSSWETDESGQYIVLYEGPVDIRFPEGFAPRRVCESTLSMRAEEQILKDDGLVRITLTDLGKFVSASDYRILEGVLEIENLSDKPIPVQISGIKVNGYYLKVYGTKRDSLSPGNILYTNFYCSPTDMRDTGIEEIESVEIGILTSEDENVGTIYGSAGGSWYPIALAEHGTASEKNGEGILVYEDDYIAVEFIGTENEWSESSSGGYGHHTWDFTFSNKTDLDLRITFEDFIIDGEPDTEGFGGYFMLCDLGANSHTKEDIRRSLDGPASMPEISFRVQIKSVGGGTLYNYAEEYVTITKEMTEQVSAPEAE